MVVTLCRAPTHGDHTHDTLVFSAGRVPSWPFGGTLSAICGYTTLQAVSGTQVL